MSKLEVLKKDPWYKDGLSFNCTGCGKCCTGFPGFVWVNEAEIHAMANFLKLTNDDFSKKYLRLIDGKLSLKEILPNYDCVFLDNNKCTIYPVRPTQCKTYPWWPQNLQSPSNWENEKKYCEGIDSCAPTVSLKVIEEQLQNHIDGTK